MDDNLVPLCKFQIIIIIIIYFIAGRNRRAGYATGDRAYSLCISAQLFVSKTSQMETPVDPDKISQEIFLYS